MAGSPQDQELPKLGESVAEPFSVALGHADHRRGHRDELVGFQLDERSGLRLADARGREQEGRRDAQDSGEACEDGGPRLLDASRFELRYRGARDADPSGELGLCEVQSLARGSDRERQGRPRDGLRDDRTLARCQRASAL
jgi:hypothetical protein